MSIELIDPATQFGLDEKGIELSGLRFTRESTYMVGRGQR